MAKSVFLVMTSAIAIAGQIAKAGTLVEVSEREAVNFLDRGKARLATAEDGVEAADELRQDGPTVAEFVAAGYPAANYPPQGFASRSTDEEIADAIAAEEAPPAADPAPAPAPEPAPKSAKSAANEKAKPE